MIVARVSLHFPRKIDSSATVEQAHDLEPPLPCTPGQFYPFEHRGQRLSRSCLNAKGPKACPTKPLLKEGAGRLGESGPPRENVSLTHSSKKGKDRT